MNPFEQSLSDRKGAESSTGTPLVLLVADNSRGALADEAQGMPPDKAHRTQWEKYVVSPAQTMARYITMYGLVERKVIRSNQPAIEISNESELRVAANDLQTAWNAERSLAKSEVTEWAPRFGLGQTPKAWDPYEASYKAEKIQDAVLRLPNEQAQQYRRFKFLSDSEPVLSNSSGYVGILTQRRVDQLGKAKIQLTNSLTDMLPRFATGGLNGALDLDRVEPDLLKRIHLDQTGKTKLKILNTWDDLYSPELNQSIENWNLQAGAHNAELLTAEPSHPQPVREIASLYAAQFINNTADDTLFKGVPKSSRSTAIDFMSLGLMFTPGLGPLWKGAAMVGTHLLARSWDLAETPVHTKIGN